MCNSSPVYNFYNCCCPDQNDSSTNGSSQNVSTIFPIKTVNAGLWTDWRTGDVNFSAPFYYPINPPQNVTEIFNNMEAFHFPYKLKELSFFKSGVLGSTNETMELSILVMDMDGAILRTLSTTTNELVSAPEESWVSIPLVSSAADLTISPSEIIVERFAISNPNNDNWECKVFISGLAEMI